MGLDMYLTRKSYIIRDYDRDGDKWVNPNGLVVEGLDLLKGTDGVKEVCEDAAYWRKANQIHNWFVQNVQDGEDECNPHEVSLEQLQELVDTCKKVLENHELAEVLLPSTSGFFFGGTDYDEHYFFELEDTVKQLEPLIAFDTELRAKEDKKNSFAYYVYQSSW